MSATIVEETDTEIKSSMQLKGGLFTLTTIQILNNNLQLLEEELNAKIEQAPNFFNHAPIVIDLCHLSKKEVSEMDIDFVTLKHILMNKKLIPVGVRNINPHQQQLAIKANLAILRSGSNLEENTRHKLNNLNYIRQSTNNPQTTNVHIGDNETENQKQQFNDTSLEPKPWKNKLIQAPVRSGQQIYAPDGDITIIGSVSNGAELLADGNIHVYGALRGRALAGINNNTQARIFCNSLEADLISIAGQFKISENIDPKFWKKQVQIRLYQGKLEITEFL